jgi:hypothetical protein
MTLRTAKISMLFGVALFYAIGAFRSLTDYNIRPSAPRSPRSRYSLADVADRLCAAEVANGL